MWVSTGGRVAALLKDRLAGTEAEEASFSVSVVPCRKGGGESEECGEEGSSSKPKR